MILSVTLILSICHQIQSTEISSPTFENTIFSENIYKALKGQQVTCRLNLNSTDDIDFYRYKSILFLQNSQNNQIGHSTLILTSSSSIHINTINLKTNTTYKCCIEINGITEQTITENSELIKCSTLKISPTISADFTSIAKIIAGLEMLVLVLIMTLCLIGIICRFKIRQSKIIEATAKKYNADNDATQDGPYLITPNAQNLQTGLTEQQPNNDSDSNKKNWQKTDFNLSMKVVTDESDFPPTYEELVLRKIENQIESIRF